MPRTLPKRTIEFKQGDPAAIILGIGDIHLGASDVDRALLESYITYVRDTPNAYWVGMGDYGDHIKEKDRRWSPAMLEPAYRERMHMPGHIDTLVVEEIIEYLTPIRDKCLGFGQGNHEETIWINQNRDLVGEIARGLDFPELLMGYTAWIPLSFKRKSSKARTTFGFNIHFHHGWKGGRKVASALGAAEVEKASKPLADLFMRGHNHQTGGDTYTAEGPNGDRDWGLMYTGTFKKGDTLENETPHGHVHWETRMGFTTKGAATMGSPRMIIHPSPVTRGIDKPFTLEYTKGGIA